MERGTLRNFFGLIVITLSTLWVEVAFSETVSATCYSPEGKRLEFLNGEKSISDDGFSNSNPTFFFSSQEPDVLIESWQSALPFPELITRSRVDEIVPPTVTKSVIVNRSDAVIHAISIVGRDAYTTTLYLVKNVAIFTRVRVVEGGLIESPKGSIFMAKCNISVLQ